MARILVLAMAAALAMVFGIAPSRAQNAYVTIGYSNGGDGGTVSVIDPASNTVIGTPIPVGIDPFGVAVTPDGSKVYVTNFYSNNVTVIATASNTVIATPITVGHHPSGVGVTPDGSKVYVTNYRSGTVSVIATAINTSPLRSGSARARGPLAWQ